jgi:leader peptidase (prepilin peptidase)/N-methyltransferase
MMPLVVAFAILGLGVGLAADRLAARWPVHEDSRVRRPDWRTATLALGGAAAFAALAGRWSDPLHLVILGAYFGALIVLAATDLDQKLLPDLVTLPLIPIALLLVLLDLDPLLAGKEMPLASALLAGLAAPAILFVLDRLLRGALGAGDLKLAIGLGLMSGVTRLFGGFVTASIASAAVILVLIAARRITLRSAIPFGPILIAGGILAALVP